MAISPLYVPLFTIEEVILDKDSGLPLAAGVVRFYRDLQRLTPKPVYKISGTSPNYTFVSVGAVLTLGLSGTFVDDNGDPFVPYAYPYDENGDVDLYYVTVVSEGSVPQFVREAVPYIGDSVQKSQRTNTENELCNPQFVEILFQEGPITLNVSGSNTVTPIAPGWDLITTGSGTVTLERLQPTSTAIPTNPPYILSISASSGLGANINLRQRLNNSPGIFRNGYVSGSFIASIISGGASNVSMDYNPSIGSSTSIINSTNIINDGAYHIISGNNQIPDQSNSPADSGYVDIIITIPTSRTIGISSLQIVGADDAVNVPFDEQTSDRQKDHLFHYYENSIINQPKANLLVGWDFGLNPYQFYSKAQTILAGTTDYVADQTILHLETAGSISSGQAGPGANFGFQLKAVNGVGTGANRFAIIQYIHYSTIGQYFGQILSSMARAQKFTDHSSQTKLKMRIIYRTAGDSIPAISASEPITGWDSNGDVTFQSGWSSINPLNDISYILTELPLATLSANNFPRLPYNKFQLPPAINSTPYLGVVTYITNPIDNTLGSEDIIVFDKVSLMQNDFALDSPPQTFDESLRKCQFYYEKSFELDEYPAVGTNYNGAILLNVGLQDGANSVLDRRSFTLDYKQPKAFPSTPTFYSPVTGASGNVRLIINQVGAGVAAEKDSGIVGWTVKGSTTQNYSLMATIQDPQSVGFSANYEGILAYQYTISSRLGL